MQMSMAVIVTSRMKNPLKKLEILQFLPRFQALSLLFLRNSYLSEYSEILCDNMFQQIYRGYSNKGCGQGKPG